MFQIRKRKEERTPYISQIFTEKTPSETECCGGTVKGICCIRVIGAAESRRFHALCRNAEEAVKRNGLMVRIEQITELADIVETGISVLPALVLNDQPVCCGFVPETEEIVKILRHY